MPNPALRCPSCNQENSPDMAFCIFCGAGMTPASKASMQYGQTGSQAITGARNIVPEDDDLNICPKCNSADPLNKEFCIICGTRLYRRERLTGMTSSVMVQSELLSLKQDISTVHTALSLQTAKPTFRIPPVVAFFMLALLGLGMGGATGLVCLQKTETSPPPLALPEKGLAILTAKPFCDILIEQPNHRDFLIGRTGRAGDIALDFEPGTYQIDLRGADGSSLYSAPATVKQGSATILGGPPGPKLVAKSATGTP